jgi:hypothetical protein
MKAMKRNIPFEVRNNYLYVKAIGEFDPSAARDFISKFVEEAKNHNLNKALCDLTPLTGFDETDISFMTRFDLADFIAKSMPSGFKLAILGTPQQLSEDIGETVMSNRGAWVKVTSDLQEALEWLGVVSDNNAPGRGTS